MNKQYILTGIKRGTTIASKNTMNSRIITEKELHNPDMIFLMGLDDPAAVYDLISQADRNERTFWLSIDLKVLFMLKAL